MGPTRDIAGRENRLPDQLLPQRGQRPVFDLLRQRQCLLRVTTGPQPPWLATSAEPLRADTRADFTSYRPHLGVEQTLWRDPRECPNLAMTGPKNVCEKSEFFQYRLYGNPFGIRSNQLRYPADQWPPQSGAGIGVVIGTPGQSLAKENPLLVLSPAPLRAPLLPRRAAHEIACTSTWRHSVS